VAYVLVDLRRRGYGIRELVARMEQAVIDMLAGQGVVAERRAGAPGVYVAGAKIAALGLRVRQGCTYHGLALNVDMDLRPFSAINPCGYAGLAVTDCRSRGILSTVEEMERALSEALRRTIDQSGRLEVPSR
jgi:lipoyl(octanoyl) transferase